MSDHQKEVGVWIPWSGGECPVPCQAKVRVKFSIPTGEAEAEYACEFRWSKTGTSGDIVAYRVIE